MGFVNEWIPQADFVKHDMEAFDEANLGSASSRDWTIDRTRDIYLRLTNIGCGNDIDLRNQIQFAFHWRGELLRLRLDLITGGGGRGEPGWSHWRLMWVGGWGKLHVRSDADVVQFTADLKEALVAFKDFGMYSTNTDYYVILDLDERCSLPLSPRKKTIWPWRW